MGIAASGKTPFVLGALSRAAFVQAGHVMLCFNPSLKWTRDHRPEIVICPATGPEILTGSTRLKAGTATKLILNMMTTLAMVELGKVRSNLMIDVQATNEKLKDRAVRMVCTLQALPDALESSEVLGLDIKVWVLWQTHLHAWMRAWEMVRSEG